MIKKKDITKIFIDEIYAKPPRKNYETNKFVYKGIDDVWSSDLAVMTDHNVKNNKGHKYILVIIDNFSKFLWTVPLKTKNAQNITDEFQNIIKTSKRTPKNLHTDRGTEYYNKNFNTLLKLNDINHYSTYDEKGSAISERVIRTIRNLLKKPVFEKGNSDWLSELSSITKTYNNTFHHSIKMTPIEASKKKNEDIVYFNLQDKRKKKEPKFKLGDLVRTADIKKVFSKGDLTNWSNKLYTITQIIDDTIPSYRINYLPERYNEAFLLEKHN